MEMKRSCSLDLRLQPSFADHLSSATVTAASHSDSGDRRQQERRNERPDETPSRSRPQDPQQLTMFYNGRICVCDVTELQARAIILLANREMEGRMNTTPPRSEPPVSPAPLRSQLHGPTGLSMKRSLQRFLQKRRHRVQAASPYHS